MEIIYTYLATDKDTQGTSLPQSCVNHTLYPPLFVADNSNFAMWEDNG